MAVTSPGGARPLQALPKAHLHLHLEGAVAPTTLADLCYRAGRSPLPGDQLAAGAAIPDDLFEVVHGVLQSGRDVHRVVAEVAQAAVEDGAAWIELAVGLGGFVGLGTPGMALETFLAAGRAAERDSGVGIGWIVTADRTRAPRLAVDLALVAAAWSGEGVVGFGLAGDETVGAPELFVDAFAVAGGAGLLRVPHAGEHAGAASVAGAERVLGAERIAYGVRALEDPDLVRRLADRGICLDVGPTADVRQEIVADLAAHPLVRLLDAGVPCSINAGAPTVFGTSLLGEYERCRTELHLDDAALAACARHSIAHSGASAELKAEALAGIDRWLGTSAGASPTEPATGAGRGAGGSTAGDVQPDGPASGGAAGDGAAGDGAAA